MKYFYILLVQFVFLLLFNNSQKQEFYFDAALWLILNLFALCYILYDLFLDKKQIKSIKRLYSIITSSIVVTLFTLYYNYLIGLLYINYFEITGIKNTLFISNGFLSNTIILLTTIILINVSFLLYIIISIFILFFLQASIIQKEGQKYRKAIITVSLILSFISILIFSLLVVKKYENPDNIVKVIKHYLYEYQYFDNETSKGIYICRNFEDVKGSIYLENNLSSREDDQIKVYPLFSEDKASYVLKYNKQYFFKIDSCM